MKIVVLAAGEVANYARLSPYVAAPDLVICADGGIRHAQSLGLSPDLILGDFDSADPTELISMADRGIPIHRVPVEKDWTDTHLALEEAVRRGADEVVLVGAIGDRLDHTLSNVLLLPGLPSHIEITIVDAKNVVRLLRPGARIVVSGAVGDYLSLLPLTPEVTGVVAEGVKWPLDGAVLRWGQSLGVSNQLGQTEASIAIRTGYLLVMSAWD